MKGEEMILNLLKEVRDEQTEQGKKQAAQGACLEDMQKDFSAMKESVAENTSNVAEHMRRTARLERQDEDKENRLQSLEEPVKARAWLKKNIKSILVLVGISSGIVTKLSGLW